MPITPAIGLSVIIHLIAIIVGLFSRLIHGKKRRKLKKTHSLSSNLISVPIIIMVFTVILLGANEMIKLSLQDKHSTVIIAKKQADKIIVALAQPSYEESLKENISNAYASNANNMTTTEGALALKEEQVKDPSLNVKSVLGEMISRADANDKGYEKAADDCQIDFYNFAAGNRWSIVNYLEAKGIDPSFENREKMAAESGITAYEGTQAQNIQLLEILFLRDVEATLSNGMFCKL